MGREIAEDEDFLDDEARMVGEIKPLLTDVVQLTQYMGKLKLRGYQEAVAETVVKVCDAGVGAVGGGDVPDGRAARMSCRRRSRRTCCIC